MLPPETKRRVFDTRLRRTTLTHDSDAATGEVQDIFLRPCTATLQSTSIMLFGICRLEKEAWKSVLGKAAQNRFSEIENPFG
jgi:hypothetical protein